MPGSIETDEDHQLITDFLNTSTSIDEFRFLWLPATDHRREETFQWMWNLEEVTVGSWAPGMPSMNRTANCMAVNRDGEFMEESCHNSGRHYYTLCVAENFNYESRDVPDVETNHNDLNSPSSGSHETIINNQFIHEEPPASLQFIGQVGNVMYFADDQLISWTESLDLCHSSGMRLATPELPNQYAFIQDYVAQQSYIYYLGGSDRLSVSCGKSNTEFRWFYSGNPIANQTDLAGDQYWYLCSFMTPLGELVSTGCAKGGGAYGRTICEISTQT